MTSPLLFPTTYVTYIRHSPILFGTRGSIPTAYHRAHLSPGSIPLRGTAASQSTPVYRSTPAFGVLRTVYLYSTIAPHVVLLGIVFWMAGVAELSTEISSSVDGLSYILYTCTYNLSCRRTTSWHLCDSHPKPSPYSGPVPISVSARHSSVPTSYAKLEPAAS